jgi:hypothetical protein
MGCHLFQSPKKSYAEEELWALATMKVVAEIRRVGIQT